MELAATLVPSFNDLLLKAGADLKFVRLMRHKDNAAKPGSTIFELWQSKPTEFERYQAQQDSTTHRKVKDSKQWASFVVTPEGETMFVGLYDVHYIGPSEDEIASPTTGEVVPPGERHVYETVKSPILAEYEGRLCIRWGAGYKAWCQYADQNPKQIIGAPQKVWHMQTLPIVETPGYAGADSRGGFETPVEREIARTPPSPSGEAIKTPDPEARRVEMERRINAHYKLLRAFADKAEGAGIPCTCTQFADALCESSIFEMKSIEHDEVSQVRAAIGQLYHYLFIHRNRSGFERAALYAVFDKAISLELDAFLREVARIGVIVFDGVRFSSDQATMERLSWLFRP